MLCNVMLMFYFFTEKQDENYYEIDLHLCVYLDMVGA